MARWDAWTRPLVGPALAALLAVGSIPGCAGPPPSQMSGPSPSGAPTTQRDAEQAPRETRRGEESNEEENILSTGVRVELPQPRGAQELQVLLNDRHSVRSYTDQPVSLEDLSVLLWAAYGHRSDGGRTAPSAGGVYPGALYACITDVSGLAPGIYRWDPEENALTLLVAGHQRNAVQEASLGQAAIGEAPLTLFFAADPERLAYKYGERSTRYALLEAGHVAQNILLAATALGLGAVPMGAFDAAELGERLSLREGEEVFYVIPVGHPAP